MFSGEKNPSKGFVGDPLFLGRECSPISRLGSGDMRPSAATPPCPSLTRGLHRTTWKLCAWTWCPSKHVFVDHIGPQKNPTPELARPYSPFLTPPPKPIERAESPPNLVFPPTKPRKSPSSTRHMNWRCLARVARRRLREVRSIDTRASCQRRDHSIFIGPACFNFIVNKPACALQFVKTIWDPTKTYSFSD